MSTVCTLVRVSSAPSQRLPEALAECQRTVREWQKLSPAFKNSDLNVLQAADSVASNVAVEDILARADKEGRHPRRILMGHLVERTETRGGHQYTKFYG